LEGTHDLVSRRLHRKALPVTTVVAVGSQSRFLLEKPT
jgi:hypothetical protein